MKCDRTLSRIMGMYADKILKAKRKRNTISINAVPAATRPTTGGGGMVNKRKACTNHRHRQPHIITPKENAARGRAQKHVAYAT